MHNIGLIPKHSLYNVETDVISSLLLLFSLNNLLTMFATRDFVFVSGFPDMVRGGTTSHLFCLGEIENRQGSQYKGLLSRSRET